MKKQLQSTLVFFYSVFCCTLYYSLYTQLTDTGFCAAASIATGVSTVSLLFFSCYTAILSVSLFGTHLLRTCWTDTDEIFHNDDDDDDHDHDDDDDDGLQVYGLLLFLWQFLLHLIIFVVIYWKILAVCISHFEMLSLIGVANCGASVAWSLRVYANLEISI